MHDIRRVDESLDVLGNDENHIGTQMETALIRVRWAYETLHLSQAGFIRLFIDLGFTMNLGAVKSESTIKSYLQGNFPQGSPDLFYDLFDAFAIFFRIQPEDFFDDKLSRTEFIRKIRERLKDPGERIREIQYENKKLNDQLQAIDTTYHNRDKSDPTPVREHTKNRLQLFIIGLIFLLIFGRLVLFVNKTEGVAKKYPSQELSAIKDATLDGRDLWLNSAQTPMQAAYGSKLCVSLKQKGLHGSVYLEDRGFFYNQEGRAFISAEDTDKKCTGIWPGVPDAFVKTPYKLFIVVSESRIPITGDSDRLDSLPVESYFGPIYIQRQE